MKSVTCKLFIQSRNESPDGSASYKLGAVCRGETNKDWAAATPSGSMDGAKSPVLDEVWRKKVAGEVTNAEVLCTITTPPAPDKVPGMWAMESCDFQYGGCQVKIRHQANAANGYYNAMLQLTINASGATRVLREAYAAGLLEGKAPLFDLYFTDATTGPADAS